MARLRVILLGFGILCAVAAPRIAPAFQPIDINGTYQVSVVDTTDNCTFSGQLVVTQSGSTFTAVVSLTLVSGTGCASSINSNASGTLTGNTISFGTAFGGFGTADFTGTVSNDGTFMSGAWNIIGGPSGTWSATRVQSAPAPALSLWSLAGLALLLSWVGKRRLQSAR